MRPLARGTRAKPDASDPLRTLLYQSMTLPTSTKTVVLKTLNFLGSCLTLGIGFGLFLSGCRAVWRALK